MKYKLLPQEGLKLIACVTMLLDHIGASIYRSTALRIIGRLSFPIYCFLLAEGIRRTRDPKKYLLRLGLGALLSELPFDLLFYGGLTLRSQNVMLTLFLGAAMLLAMQKYSKPPIRLLLIGAFCLLAELLNTDYGGKGILLIALFGLTDRLPIHLAGLVLISLLSSFGRIRLLGLPVPIQLFGVLAMIPIGLYNGRKLTGSRPVQWSFYLFYPVHMLLLLAMKILL